MKELYEELRAAAERYFDKKISGAKISDGLEQDLWNAVEDYIIEIQDMADDVARDIDREIENFDYDAELENIKDDIRTQEYLERI